MATARQMEATRRYGAASIALHWFMILLLAAVYASMELREFFPRGSDPREALKSWHYMLGLCVFVLVWIRLGVAIVGGVPAGERGVAGRLARMVHIALYLLMVLMPLGGWLTLSAEGELVPFFGLELPALVGRNPALAEQIKELHEIAGKTGYFLIALHAAAALFHHYVLRDETLARIAPWLRPARP